MKPQVKTFDKKNWHEKKVNWVIQKTKQQL